MTGNVEIIKISLKEEENTCEIKRKIDVTENKSYGEKDVSQNSFSNTVKRYSRYDLLSLRNGQLSIHYPHCALRPDLQALSIWTCRLRCELQYLGLWKIPNTGNPYGNCSCNGSCQSYACTEGQPYITPNTQVNAVNPQVCYGNVQQVQQLQARSSPTLGSKRAVRSRERSLNYQRCINTELIRATSPSVSGIGEGSIQHHLNYQVKPAFIDHRSISSAHLMPAFAKRRMGHANVLHGQSETCANFNHISGQNSEHLSNDNGSSEIPLKSRKDSAKALSSSNQNDYHNYKQSADGRLDKNDQSLVSPTGWMNLVKNVNSDYTPSNNKPNNGGSVNKKLIYERRIGSGRLVPREVNWDIRTINNKLVEKENNSHSSVSNGEKEKLAEVDKLNSRNSPTTRFPERRIFDRRTSNSDDSNNCVSNTLNKRYTTTSLGEEKNNFEANYHQQQTQHFTGQRSMSFRRREYVEHKDHNRDFRETKDSREGRELREQRGGDQHHHNHHRKNKGEPEWFSEGPTSQHDTIELRGFEETDESQQQTSTGHYLKVERKTSESSLVSHNSSSNVNYSTKENVDITSKVSNNSSNTTNKFGNGSSSCNNVPDKTTPIKEIADANESLVDTQQHNISHLEELESSDKSRLTVTELFFDNILNIEALENSLIGSDNDLSMAANNDGGGGTSRFSRWFFNNSNNNINCNNELNPPAKEDSKHHKKDINETDFNSFMTFLKSNNFPTPELPKCLPSNVSALSVEELEARMRKIDSSENEKIKSGCGGKNLPNNGVKQSKKSECDSEADTSVQTAEINSEDVEAFRKLLDQLGKPRVDISMNIILPNTGQPHPLTTPVNVYPTDISPIPYNTLPQSNVSKQEYMMKILHQQQILHNQQQNVGKMAASHIQNPSLHRVTQISPQQQTENFPLMPVPPLHLQARHTPMIMGHPQKRIDVQHLIQSVLREELSRNFLEKELKNPNIPTYTKEIISTVLKETSRCNASAAAGQNAPDSIETVTSDISAAPNNLMQSLARGEVSLNLIEHELNKLNNLSIANDTSTNGSLKERSRCSTPLVSLLNVASSPTSGGVVLPSQVVTAQKQNSFLSNENTCTISSDHTPTISSMLRSQHHHHEDPTLHVPTQRELQMHTQAIMQNALFKKKLEVEQHEALRRRQEIHKQQELDSSNIGQHHHQQNSLMSQQSGNHQQTSRHMNSPTPLAFTPTSVLRKMTAEKDTTSSSNQATTITSSLSQHQIPSIQQQPHLKVPTHSQMHGQQLSYHHSNQPRMILGGGNFQYIHQQQQNIPAVNGSPQISPQQKSQICNQLPGTKWPLISHACIESSHPMLNNMGNKPMGRPILKGPGPVQPIMMQNLHNALGQNPPNANQNSQAIPTVPQMQKYPSIQQQPRQIVGQQFPTHIIQHQIPTSQQQNTIQQQLFQQRSVAMQRQQIQQNDLGNLTSLSQSAHHPACNDNNSVTNLNYQRDGGLSPTSNQLAQWFSPELLAQASAGKLPLLNMNQALSLEEFERSIQHSSTAVNN